MTTARITYNGTNIDIAYGVQGYNPSHMQQYSSNRSTGGIIERINEFGWIDLNMDLFFDSDTYESMFTWWWSWARLGYEFTFALDYSKDASTTLDADAASAQKIIPVASTVGIVAGDKCQIISAANGNRELITILNKTGGVSVTAEANLINSFASGDEFRHMDYYPLLVSNDNDFKPVPQAGAQFYKISVKWQEVIE